MLPRRLRTDAVKSRSPLRDVFGAWLLAAAIVLAAASRSEAATYYVRSDGNNANSGTGSDAANAWATVVGAATKTLSAGDIVYVRKGTYVGEVQPSVDGTAANPIRFIADADGAVFGTPGDVVLQASTGVHVLDIQTDDYLHFVGFQLQGDNSSSDTVESNALGFVLDRCEIYDGGGAGVDVNGGSITLINCLIRDNAGDGVSLDDGNLTVWNCTLVANGSDGIEQHAGTSTITNSIVASHSSDGLDLNAGTMTHTYNLVYGSGDLNWEGTSASTGEISVNPLFVGGGDYHLRATSPPKDAGTSASGTVDDDFHGNPRPYNTNWDMGYHEYGATRGPKALLLISENNGYLTAQERTRKTLFEIWGYAVTALWDGESQTNYDAALAASSVVYVSEESSSTDVSYKLRESTLGVMIEEAASSDEMGMSSTTSDPGTHAGMTIDDNSHYITSPFASGSLTIYDSAQDVRTLSGTVATGASVLGSYSASNALAVVDIGDSLFNSYNGSSIAFGRRVFLPLGEGFDFTSLTDDGMTLVRRALEWVAGDLVGHWKLDETSGTLAADSSGHGNDGTYTNGPVLAQTGIYGTAVNFDGNDDRVIVPDDPTLNVTANVTMAAWVHPVQTGNTERMIINKEGEYEMALTDTGELKWAYKNTDPGWSWHHTGTIVPDGQWSHLAVTYSEGTVRSYVNGVLVDTYYGSGDIGDQYPTYNDLWIGARSNNPTGASFKGLIDDARVYSKPLTAAEVADLYDLHGHWRLDENSGTVAADASPQGHDGTYTSGPTLAGAGAYPGDVLTSVEFDGVDDHVDLPSIEVDFSTGFTAACWVKLNDTPGTGQTYAFLDISNGQDVDEVWLGLVGGAVGFQLYMTDTADASSLRTIEDNAGFEEGKWVHCVATVDAAGNALLYRNGEVTKSQFTSLPTNVLRTQNSLGTSPLNDEFPGSLDDVRIYNRPLSAAEVAELFGLVGHWKMNEGAGTTAADSTGFSNDAAISGAVWTSDCTGNVGLEFDGTSDTATTGSPFEPPATGAVAFWMRGSGPIATRQRPFGVNADWEGRVESTGTMSFDLGASPYVGNEPFATTTHVDDEDRWYHIIATFNATDNTYEVYVNGALEASGISPVNLVEQVDGILSFGTRTGSAEYWQGALRDFRIYNRWLSASEIGELSGLIGYWKLDETSGTVASDSSPNAYDGTLSGNPTWITAGNIDGALDFETSDGDDSVDVGTFDVSGSEISIAAWVRPEDGGTDRRIIIKASGLSLAEQYWGMAVGTSLELDFRLKAGGTTDFFTEANVLSPGKWFHTVGTYDGTTMRMYVNGVEVRSVVHSVGGTLDVDATVPVTIGAANVSGRPFDGVLDDVRVFNRVMCPEEVRGLYRGGRPAGVRILQWVEAR